MEDLDRLFALVDLISDPKTAQKNVAEMKKLKDQEATNKLLLKEANAVSYAAHADRDSLDGEWVDLNEAREVLKGDQAQMAKGRLDLEAARQSSIAEDNRRKDKMKEIENTHAKKISELKAKLALVEASVADAVNRKVLAETDLDRMRQRIG